VSVSSNNKTLNDITKSVIIRKAKNAEIGYNNEINSKNILIDFSLVILKIKEDNQLLGFILDILYRIQSL
jgi:hypothetical protein